MKRRNILGFALVLAVVVFAFTSCGRGDDDGDGVVLRWMVGGGGHTPVDAAMVWEAVNEELQNYLPGVTLDITVVPFGEYDERWMLEAAAGAEWDIAWFGWMLNLQHEVRMGTLMPLNDLLDSYGQDIRTELPEFMFTNNTVDGNIYLIASNQLAAVPSAGFIAPRELIERHMDVPAFEVAAQEWADSDLLFPPASLMDVIENYIQSTYDAGEMGMGISAGTFHGHIATRNVWYALGGNYRRAAFTRAHDPTSRVYSIFDITEEEVAFYERISDWFNRGFIRSDGMTVENWEEDFYHFEDGHGYVFRVHNYNRYQSGIQTERHGFDVVVLPILYPRAPTQLNPTNTSMSIMSGASHPEEAMQFLNLINSAQGQGIYNMIVHGLEGTHWNFVDEAQGVIELTDIGDNYEIPFWVVGNTYYAFVTPGFDPGYTRYITRVFNHSAMPMPLEGFVFDSSNLVAESIAWNTIWQEFYQVLVVGISDDVRGHIEERNRRFEEGGARNFAIELQRQIDEFKAGN
ncbi:MAG: ABC transporter substrate-binding protein [Defluviitaleaceae bacterium]|nr:ABC transporter substrate-binding protein [Defluviitaleaceae bacterium]